MAKYKLEVDTHTQLWEAITQARTAWVAEAAYELAASLLPILDAAPNEVKLTPGQGTREIFCETPNFHFEVTLSFTAAGLPAWEGFMVLKESGRKRPFKGTGDMRWSGTDLVIALADEIGKTLHTARSVEASDDGYLDELLAAIEKYADLTAPLTLVDMVNEDGEVTKIRKWANGATVLIQWEGPPVEFLEIEIFTSPRLRFQVTGRFEVADLRLDGKISTDMKPAHAAENIVEAIRSKGVQLGIFKS